MNPETKKITYKYSAIWVALPVLLFLGCLGLGYYFYTTDVDNTARKEQLTASNAATTRVVGTLRTSYSDQKTKKTREDADAIQKSMMEDAEADAFIASLRPIWALTLRTETANDEYIHRRYQISRGSAPVSTWDEVRALLERLNGMSVLSVDNIEIQTVGDNRKREFSRITINLSVYIKKPA